MPAPSSTLIDELSWRGLIHDSTDLAQLDEHLRGGRRRFYIGFDPSASSLTIGNLLPMTLVMRGVRAGLDAVVLLGGGTGLIGDPSGKSAERSLLPVEEAQSNVARHEALMTEIFSRGLQDGEMPFFVDNGAWLKPMSMIDFLRDVGKHFPVGEMIRRDSVRRRLDDPEASLTYTEFSYSLLQGYDFMRLHEDHSVTLQMGASDQWGNIVAGIDYVRRVSRSEVYGLTCPLLLRSDGTKFGKTERGAVWISADKTSPYTLYQFMLNLADDEANKFARFFSLEPREVLEKNFSQHGESPSKRILQRHLAREITALLHGADACEKAEAASWALFSGDVGTISAEMMGDVFADVPTVDLAISSLDDEGFDIVELLVATQLASSKRDAREHLSNGAVLVNGDKASEAARITRANLLHGSLVLVRRGRRKWSVARFS